MTHVDGRAKSLQSHLYDLDGAVDARAEPARCGEQDRKRWLCRGRLAGSQFGVDGHEKRALLVEIRDRRCQDAGQ
jgi:hypothetical protein